MAEVINCSLNVLLPLPSCEIDVGRHQTESDCTSLFRVLGVGRPGVGEDNWGSVDTESAETVEWHYSKQKSHWRLKPHQQTDRWEGEISIAGNIRHRITSFADILSNQEAEKQNNCRWKWEQYAVHNLAPHHCYMWHIRHHFEYCGKSPGWRGKLHTVYMLILERIHI